MVGLIVLGLVLSRVLGSTNPHVSKDRAVEIARPHAGFKPQGHTIRLVRQGIPPRAFWAISFWKHAPSGAYSRITIVLVDAGNGRIEEVRRAK
jgi:hypothetical protein